MSETKKLLRTKNYELMMRPTCQIIPSAFTLLEIVITLALIAFLAALFFPSWKGLSRATALSSTETLVLSSLEQARLAAIQEHAETWVVFQHRAANECDRFCMLQETEDGTIKLLMPWAALSTGVALEADPESIMTIAPPEKIMTFLVTLPEAAFQADSTLGTLHYNTQGAIMLPAIANQDLHLDLVATSTNSVIHDQIFFSPLTGRAFKKEN